MLLGRYIPLFWRNLLPSFPPVLIDPVRGLVFSFFQYHVSFLPAWLLFHSEDGGRKLRWNIATCLPNYTISQKTIIVEFIEFNERIFCVLWISMHHCWTTQAEVSVMQRLVTCLLNICIHVLSVPWEGEGGGQNKLETKSWYPAQDVWQTSEENRIFKLSINFA